LTTAPARVVGIPAPRIREGASADLVLVDPKARFTVDVARLRTKSSNTPFLGKTLTGRVELTLCEGRVVHDELSAGAAASSGAFGGSRSSKEAP
jgi:dihydroorotase